jgi:hypothetical protein
MPIEATPLEHPDAVAVATNFTEVPTVLLFDGLVTVTPAKAETATNRNTTRAVEIGADFFILRNSPGGILSFDPRKVL